MILLCKLAIGYTKFIIIWAAFFSSKARNVEQSVTSLNTLFYNNMLKIFKLKIANNRG